MRRTLKEGGYAGCGDGGLLSKIHAAAESGTNNVAVVSRTTLSVWTTVTGGTISLQALRRSAVTHVVWHDCDTDTVLLTSTPG